MSNYLKIIAAMLIWSTWGPMVRWLDLPPLIIIFATSLISSITVPLFMRHRGEMNLAGVKAAWLLFGLLTAASLLNNVFYFYALAHTTVSNAVFTHYTAPLFVAVLAPFMLAERLRTMTLISLAVSIAGMILIVSASGGLRFNSGHAAGMISGTASGLAYAFIIIYSRKLSTRLLHHKAVVVVAWATAIVTLPAVFLLDYHITPQKAGLLLLVGIFHSTLAPLLYYNAMKTVIAQHAAILGYMEPLAAIPMAFLLLAETPSLLAIAGGALILVSGYLVIRSHEDGPAT